MTEEKNAVEREKNSGKTFIKENIIYWIHREKVIISIDITTIKIIGEYTIEADPMEDDWYIVFVLNENEIKQIPANAVGVEDMLTQLSERLGTPLSIGLFYSTRLNSRIIWPKKIEDLQLYEAKPAPAKNFLGKLWIWLKIAPMELVLTKPALSVLKEE
jgi:hypothetical protein